MKYRKKPVVIEALQMTQDQWINNAYWPDWLITLYEPNDVESYPTYLFNGTSENGFLPVIHTLEGNHTVSFGDYIIKGVKGEIYPCKPEIFEMTYDLVI